jgi:hypothetical protein
MACTSSVDPDKEPGEFIETLAEAGSYGTSSEPGIIINL